VKYVHYMLIKCVPQYRYSVLNLATLYSTATTSTGTNPRYLKNRHQLSRKLRGRSLSNPDKLENVYRVGDCITDWLYVVRKSAGKTWASAILVNLVARHC
jgi:hypothetical protein